MYAAMHAKYFLKKHKLRVLSLGTGHFEEHDEDLIEKNEISSSKLSYFTDFDRFIEKEVETSDKIMKELFVD